MEIYTPIKPFENEYRRFWTNPHGYYKLLQVTIHGTLKFNYIGSTFCLIAGQNVTKM